MNRRGSSVLDRILIVFIMIVLLLLLVSYLKQQNSVIDSYTRLNSEQSSKISQLEQKVEGLHSANLKLAMEVNEKPVEVKAEAEPTQENRMEKPKIVDGSTILALFATIGTMLKKLVPAL